MESVLFDIMVVACMLYHSYHWYPTVLDRFVANPRDPASAMLLQGTPIAFDLLHLMSKYMHWLTILAKYQRELGTFRNNLNFYNRPARVRALANTADVLLDLGAWIFRVLFYGILCRLVWGIVVVIVIYLKS